jgi:putative endonuclease
MARPSRVHVKFTVAREIRPAKDALRSFSEAGPESLKCTRPMYYVYLLQSQTHSGRRYTGFSTDLRQRFADHNAGKLSTTARCRPWNLVTYIAFSSKRQALAFERYLKSGSGHAFAKRRLW